MSSRGVQAFQNPPIFFRSFHHTSPLSLNRFLFDPEEIQTEATNDTQTVVPTVTLPKDDYRTIHAASTLKLENGDVIRAGIVGCEQTAGQFTDQAAIKWLPEPPVKKAEVLKNGKPPGPLVIQLHNLTTSQPQQHQIPVSLILALPRPLQIGRILPMISQIGVDSLVLTSARKVPKDYFGSHLFRKPEQLRERLVEGLCQAGDVQLPKLKVVKVLKHFIEDDFDAMFPRNEYARVIAHPQRPGSDVVSLRMNQVQFPTQPARMVLAVGPEGGWEEPGELDMFESLGFQQVTMGSRTLRTDCAVVGLLTLAHELCNEKNDDESL